MEAHTRTTDVALEAFDTACEFVASHNCVRTWNTTAVDLRDDLIGNHGASVAIVWIVVGTLRMRFVTCGLASTDV